jgi:hypothetical protein
MKLIDQDAIYYIKSKNADADIKKLMDAIYANLRNQFSKVQIGANAIIFSNNFLSYLIRWNLIDLISSAEILAEPKKNYFILRTKISFLKLVKFNLAIVFLIFLAVLADTDEFYLHLMSAIFLLLITYIFSQISGIRFGSMIVNCVKNSGMEID